MNHAHAIPGKTHILIHYLKGQQSQLFRASDGMLIGIRIGQVVKCGDDPNHARQHIFLNESCADLHLKSLALEDLLSVEDPFLKVADIEERDGEPLIETASSIHPGAMKN